MWSNVCNLYENFTASKMFLIQSWSSLQISQRLLPFIVTRKLLKALRLDFFI